MTPRSVCPSSTVRDGDDVSSSRARPRRWAYRVTRCTAPLLRPEFPLASPPDIDIPRCVDTAAQAVALIRPRYEEWRAELSNSR